MPTFTNVFGGSNINPSDLSFSEITFSANLTLSWPRVGGAGTPLSDKVDVSATTSGLSISLPPANQVSVGQDALIFNAGANSIDIKNYDGTFLVTLTTGQSIFICVKNNATAAGTWRIIRFGVGTSSADASALVGSGLVVLSGLLNQNHPISTKSVGYTVVDADRAKLIVSTGAAIGFALPSPASVGSWFVFIKNAGTGVLTLTPAAGTIDGSATKAMAVGESLVALSDGSNYITAFYNQTASSSVSNVNINVAGTGTSSLVAAEVAASIQNFTGLLTGNRIIEYGVTAGYWFVNNATTGAFTLTLRVGGADTGIVLAAGTHGIIVSNGTNLVSALSTATGTVTSIATGTGLTGGPVTTTGTFSLANTAVTPASYGNSTNVPSFTVDAQGRLTAAANVAIAFPSAAVADGSITAIKLASDAVTTIGILDANVTTAKIADGNVTAAKLASGVALSNLGFTPVNKAGDTISGVITMGAALKGVGSTAAVTGFQINSGADIGTLFCRTTDRVFVDTGSGSLITVTDVIPSMSSAVNLRLTVYRTRYEPGGGGTGS